MNVYRMDNRYSVNIVRFFAGSQRKRNALLLALLVLLGVSVYWGINRQAGSSVVVSKESICIVTTVKTGSYEMPAFNTASFRVMSGKLKDTNFKASCNVDAPLELRYTMTFNAQKTSWQAELVAVDEAGKMVWQGADRGAIQNVGAFQYTTESAAERLLEQFLTR